MTNINEPTAIDETLSIIFDFEFRIETTRDNLNTAEQLLNEAREKMKERKLQVEDFQRLESLLLATKEFFEVAAGDLMDELYRSLKGYKDSQNDAN